jgi:hypothetical protein
MTMAAGNQEPEGTFRVRRECRTLLRELLTGSGDAAAREHAERCGDCAARLAARDRLASALRQRPQLPDEVQRALSSGRDLLRELVHERAVENAQSSVLGRALAEAQPVPAPQVGDWHDGLLVSRTAQRTGERPASASPLQWARVRQSILDSVAEQGVVKRRTARVRQGLAFGVAAAAILGAVGLFLGQRPPTNVPTIVFRDVDTMPGVDFAVVRYGAMR